MQADTWYVAIGICLFVVGLFGLTACRDLLRKILGLNIMGSGVFLLLVAPADRLAGGTPNSVPHAMVLTGIVVAVSATALALALAARISSPSDEDPFTQDAAE